MFLVREVSHNLPPLTREMFESTELFAKEARVMGKRPEVRLRIFPLQAKVGGQKYPPCQVMYLRTAQPIGCWMAEPIVC